MRKLFYTGLLLSSTCLPASTYTLDGRECMPDQFGVPNCITPADLAAYAYRQNTAINVVTDSGAKCDGTTDDSAAFATANTAAAAINGTVLVPAGTCRLGSNFSLSVNVNLVGTPGHSILKATNSNASNPVLLVLTGGNNFIYGITFDGNSSGSSNTGNVVTAFQVANVVFDTDKWQNTIGIGVIFSTSISYSGVRNSQFRNVGNFSAALASRHQGIDFCCGTATNNTNNFATGNDFFDFGLDAISPADQYYFLAANNRFNTSGVWNGTLGVACIYLNGNHYSSITGNVCYNASGNGIDEISSFDSAITGNTITFAGQSGISTAYDTNLAITGNSISNSNQLGSATTNSGIVVFGICSNVAISGNVISDDQNTPTQQYGIKYVTGSPSTGACTNLNVGANIGSGNTVLPTNLAPVLTSCGTNPAVVGDNKSGLVTMGTGAPAGCVITFAAAYAIAPPCSVVWQATPLASQSYVVSASAITLTQTATSSNKVSYNCAP